MTTADPGPGPRITKPLAAGHRHPLTATPPTRRRSPLTLCARCFQLYGERGGIRQLCHCASSEELEAASESAFRIKGSYWRRIEEICRCCGVEAVDTSHKFCHWFCDDCRARVREVNFAFGSCVIPVGWHSVVNGVFFRSDRAGVRSSLEAFADQLDAFFREAGDTWRWGCLVIARHWDAAGLLPGEDVSLDSYLDAVAVLDVDKPALFDELVSARGIPPHWRTFADAPPEHA